MGATRDVEMVSKENLDFFPRSESHMAMMGDRPRRKR